MFEKHAFEPSHDIQLLLMQQYSFCICISLAYRHCYYITYVKIRTAGTVALEESVLLRRSRGWARPTCPGGDESSLPPAAGRRDRN